MPKEKPKSTIRVYILNYHRMYHSATCLLLEDISSESPAYYWINRGVNPKNYWTSGKYNNPLKHLNKVSSIFDFTIEIDASREEIADAWYRYYYRTQAKAKVDPRENCAVSVQWFLSSFADIPEPSLSNISLNYVWMGLFWPSFIPCPITLPGRVMDNVKFHINTSNELEKRLCNPHRKTTDNLIYAYTALAVSLIAFSGSLLALTLAESILQVALASMIITASSYGFFNAYNKISAEQIIAAKMEESPTAGII